MTPRARMQKIVALCWAVLLVGATGQSGDANSDSPEGSSDVWVATNYLQVLDQVLGVHRPTRLGLPKEVRWFTSIQIVPSRRAEEVLTLTVFEDGRVSVDVRRPSDAPLSALMSRLHVERPTAGAKEIAAVVPVDSKVITGDSCPEVKTEANRFLKLRLGTSPRSGLILHGTGYNFVVAHWAGFQLEGRVSGNETLGHDQVEPIAGWAERLRSIIIECETRGTREHESR